MVEALEGRRLLAAGYGASPSPTDTIYEFNGGAVRFTQQAYGYQNHLVVCGSDGDDTITVTPVDTAGRNWLVAINGQSQVFADPSSRGIEGVDLYGYGGNDRLELDVTAANQPFTMYSSNSIYGGAGDDTLVGADRPGFWTRDLMYGEAGDDALVARDGDDLLQGGAGNDDLYGGAGADSLWGDAEQRAPQVLDFHDGGADGDRVNGVQEQTKDNWTRLLGGGTVTYRETASWWGTSASMNVYGTAGDDVIKVSAGYNDTLRIEINGRVHRVANADIKDGFGLYVYGQDGNDRIEMNLTLAQRARLDVYADMALDGGSGNDALYGSAGRETLRTGPGTDLVHAGGGDDRIEVDEASANAGTLVFGEGGDDFIDVGRHYAYDAVIGLWRDAYAGTTAGVDGGTGVDTLNGVAETFDAARDAEPPPSLEPDVEPLPEPEDPEPEFVPADEGTLTDEEIMALARFVGPLAAAEHEAFQSALADRTGGVGAAPHLAWPAAPQYASTVDEISSDLQDEGQDELLT